MDSFLPHLREHCSSRSAALLVIAIVVIATCLAENIKDCGKVLVLPCDVAAEAHVHDNACENIARRVVEVLRSTVRGALRILRTEENLGNHVRPGERLARAVGNLVNRIVVRSVAVRVERPERNARAEL